MLKTTDRFRYFRASLKYLNHSSLTSCSLKLDLDSIFQHGFFKGRSVKSNLLPFVQFLHGALDRGMSVDAVYTDFSKAFDKKTLLVKLENIGVHGNLLRWIDR